MSSGSLPRLLAALFALFALAACAAEQADLPAVDGGSADVGSAEPAVESECSLSGTFIRCTRYVDPRPDWFDDERFESLQLYFDELPADELALEGEIDLVTKSRDSGRVDLDDPRLGGFTPDDGELLSARVERSDLFRDEERLWQFERTAVSGHIAARPDGCFDVSLMQSATDWFDEPWAGVACPSEPRDECTLIDRRIECRFRANHHPDAPTGDRWRELVLELASVPTEPVAVDGTMDLVESEDPDGPSAAALAEGLEGFTPAGLVTTAYRLDYPMTDPGTEPAPPTFERASARLWLTPRERCLDLNVRIGLPQLVARACPPD